MASAENIGFEEDNESISESKTLLDNRRGLGCISHSADRGGLGLEKGNHQLSCRMRALPSEKKSAVQLKMKAVRFTMVNKSAL
jgi:hypothetical protein